MIELDDNGNFSIDSSNHLKYTATPEFQNFKSEVRCIQETWIPDLTFGRNTLVWTLSQSPQDRCADLYRIGTKYMPVKSVLYNSINQEYSVQV